MLHCTVKSYYELVNLLVEKVFDDTGFKNLKKMYNCLYSSEEYDIQPFRFYIECKQIFVNGELFLSSKSHSQRSNAIAAHWLNISGIDTSGEAPLRVGIISYFLRHELKLISKSSASIIANVNVLAHIKWFEDHPYKGKYIPTLCFCDNVCAGELR